MADWLQGPVDDDEESPYSGIVQALASPEGTAGDTNGAAPGGTPQVVEVAAQPDPNEKDDRATQALAAVPAPQEEGDAGPVVGGDDSGLPPDESMLSSNPSEMTPTAPAPEPAAASDEEQADVEANQLAGNQQSLAAPAPLVYKPYEDHSADQQALVDLKAPDPKNYKPSVARRIGAGLAAAAMGFGHIPNAAEVGEAALNAPYTRANASYQAQREPLQQKIVADQAADQAVDRQNTQATNVYNAAERNMSTQARVADWNAQAQQRRDIATARLNTVDRNTLGPVDLNNPMGEWQGKTPGGKVVRGLDPPASITKSPQYQMQQRRSDLKNMMAAGIKFTPQEAKYYIVNGKLAEPTVGTHIDIHENPDGSAVAPGRGAGNPGGTGDIIAKNMQNKQAFIDNWQRVGKESATDAIPEGSYINTAGTGTMSGKEYNDRIAKFRTDLNADPTMRRAGVTVDENGNTVGGGPAAPPAAAPAATAPPAPAPARNTPPVRNTPSEKSNPAVPPKATMPKPAGADGRRVKGSDGNWYWLNAKNQVLGRSN